MPVDYCQSKHYTGFAVTVMMGANTEPENRQFSEEKLHNVLKKSSLLNNILCCCHLFL